jgi:hypothetical protein
VKRRTSTLALLALLLTSDKAVSQSVLSISLPTGLKVVVVQKDFPLLKLLLRGQTISDRGIEIEFPEHVTGLNEKTNRSEHLYLVTRGNANKRTLPVWRIEGNSLVYETEFDSKIKMIATAHLDSNGVRYTYKFINHSSNSNLS